MSELKAHTVEADFAGQPLKIETGAVARQAAGSCLITYGETTVLCAVGHSNPRPGLDFFPLSVDYRERMAAAGKFPGGFLKREGRPTQKEILTARLTDRPIRPLWPKGYKDEIQIMLNVLSCDGENDPDVLGITGASTCLMLADVPFQGPIAAVRVGLVDGEFVAMPTVQQVEESSLDLVLAGSMDSILMIEGFAEQLPEDEMVDAIMFGHEFIQELCKMQVELQKKAGVEKTPYEAPPENPFKDEILKKVGDKLREVKKNPSKSGRSSASREVRKALQEEYFADGAEETTDGRSLADFKEGFYQADKSISRELTLKGERLDGRGLGDLRQVTCEVSNIPRVHGSAIFTRGETQSVATVTLGTLRDQQRVDGLFDETSKSFMLDYNFPPYSVGEVRPIRGPGRREIGHGALAERSVQPVMPKYEKFPYTIRVISDITESNGSSSMASVCSATLALMDAGVPIRQPVAGISIGVIKEGDDYALLTDIIGDEDHFGDMDFKVAGSQKGITGIQLDLKIDGITEPIIRETLKAAREARLKLLKTMLTTTINRPRSEVAENAPRIETTKIDPEKIGLLIGPGGKTIKAMQEATGANIDIEDDGTVMISGSNADSCRAALAKIEAMTEEIRVGRVYNGTVSSVKDFGAFVEIAPGKDGLVHISELDHGFVKTVTDVCKVGDKMEVKVIAVDDQNRVKLSRKVLLEKPAEEESDDDFEDDEYED